MYSPRRPEEVTWLPILLPLTLHYVSDLMSCYSHTGLFAVPVLQICQTGAHLRILTVALPSTSNALLPDTHKVNFFTSFKSLFKWHLLNEAHADPLFKITTASHSQPVSTALPTSNIMCSWLIFFFYSCVYVYPLPHQM